MAFSNQPQSTTSNQNQSKQAAAKRPPKRNKKAKYTKPPKVAHKAKIDNSQSKLINRLSKQVYSLQMSKYGNVQQNYHTLRTALVPQSTQPLCLDLTDFTCNRPDGPAAAEGARVYQHVGMGLPAEASVWSIVPYENNYYWNKQNKDQPDGGSYLAMSATYFIEVKGVNSLDNTRVRFDVISQKPNAIISTPSASDNVLPNTLVHMKHLATPMGASSNRINPIYFRKYFSKTVFVNSALGGETGTKGTTANIIRFSFKLKPNKLCTQQYTNPSVGNLDPQPEISRGNFGPYNVHASQPLWMVISTDDISPIGDAVSVNISRRIVWRDTIGSANM